jgi:hypothetical protein
MRKAGGEMVGDKVTVEALREVHGATGTASDKVTR